MKDRYKKMLVVISQLPILTEIQTFFSDKEVKIDVCRMMSAITDYLEDNPLPSNTINGIAYYVTFSDKIYDNSKLTENQKLGLFSLINRLIFVLNNILLDYHFSPKFYKLTFKCLRKNCIFIEVTERIKNSE